MNGRLAAAVLLAAAGCSRPAAGSTYAYSSGNGRVQLAAGVERSELSLDRGEGSFTVNRAFSMRLEGARGSFEARMPDVRGPGQYAGSGSSFRLVYLGRAYPSEKGGACALRLTRVDAAGADGSVSCVGLATIGGKGYDVLMTFRLTA